MAVMLLLSQQLYVWGFSLTPRFLCRLQEAVFNTLASGVVSSLLHVLLYPVEWQRQSTRIQGWIKAEGRGTGFPRPALL